MYILAETSYFAGSSFQFLLSVLFIEPNIDDADNDYSISTLQKERQSDTRLPFYLIKFTSIKNNNLKFTLASRDSRVLRLQI